MCQSGAREVQEKVLHRLPSADLKVFTVWLPQYEGDSRIAALSAKRIVSDGRALHFWDSLGALGERYGQLLDLPANRTFAWDVYMVFDQDTNWKEKPPTPAYWMHQLDADTAEHPRLDGDLFRQVIDRLQSPTL